MKVGHGTALLPVPDGTRLGGYADRIGTSLGRFGDLQVHALAIADSTGAMFALVECDVVCVNADLVADCVAELRNIGFAEAWVGATHTHSGPDTGCLPAGTSTPEPWRATLRDAVVAAARSAMTSLVQAIATTHPCVVSGVAGIRSSPPNLIDVPVDVIALHDTNSRLIGLFVVVPIHSTVLPAANLAVSADLIGGIRTYLERATGAWAVVATGAAGDISTRHGRRSRTVAELTRLSAVIGQRVVQALASPSLPVAEGRDALTFARRVVSAPVRSLADPRPPRAATTTPLGRMDRDSSWLRNNIDQGTPAIESASIVGELAVPLAVVGLGDLALCAIPGEPFLASAQQLRLSSRGSHATTLLLGCTNGYRGYLPTADRFDAAGYEVLVSPFAQGTAERLVVELADMVSRLPDSDGDDVASTLASLPGTNSNDHDTERGIVGAPATEA